MLVEGEREVLALSEALGLLLALGLVLEEPAPEGLALVLGDTERLGEGELEALGLLEALGDLEEIALCIPSSINAC